MTITLNGSTDTVLGFKVLTGSSQPLLPGTRDRSVSITGRHGSRFFGSDLEGRAFEFICQMTGTSAANLQTKVRALAAFLLDSTGRAKVIPLVFDNDPGKTYDVRVNGGVEIDRMGAGIAQFSLSFIADDPFAYGALSTVAEGGSLVNAGNVEAYPIITGTFTGAASALELRSHSGQSYIKFTRPFIAGAVLTVDMEKMSADVDGVNILPAMVSGSTFWTIAPGATITPIVTETGGTGIVTVSYAFRPRYI